MTTTSFVKRDLFVRYAIFVSLLAAWQAPAYAVNGTWTNVAGGDYDVTTNWQASTVASGAGSTADFSTLDIASDVIVTKETPLTIGNLKFGDTNTGTGGSWLLSTASAQILTLDNSGSAPNITVNPLLPFSAQDDANINLPIASTLGFNKLGNGVLTLSGASPDLHGTVSVNAGTLRVAATATFDYEDVTDVNKTQFAMTNGTVLEIAAQVGDTAANDAGVSVAAGSTATIRVFNAATVSAANVRAAGAGTTLNLDVPAGTLRLDRDWGGATPFGTVNMVGPATGNPSTFLLRPNGASFNDGSFGSTAVTLTNATLQTNTNSFVNQVQLGSLTGDSVSILAGGATGVAVMYNVGNLNTNTTFAGATTTGSGFSLNKVGTGKLTLSGALAHSITSNASADLRGGITRVTTGTLALTGTAVIPGGINDATLGDLFTTIDLKAGTTLDVSGTAAPYTSVALQQLIGNGTVVGTYNHAAGSLRPGDVPVGNEHTATSATGTLTFAGALNVSGGAINYDISPATGDYNSNGLVDTADYVVWRNNEGTNNPLPNRDPANGGPIGGADYNSWRARYGNQGELIRTNGGALSGNVVVDVGILPGAVAGTYTIIDSAVPLTGSIAGWTVNWTGRGTTPTLTQTANKVQLNAAALVPPATLRWRGDLSNIWDVGAGGTSNWQNTTTNAPDKFFTRDTVQFLDTYDGVTPPANFTVALNSVVSPGAVVVNSTQNYTINGTGRITGTASFLKQGTSRLSITNSNDYSGGTTISGGIVDLEGTGRLGTRAITLNGAQLHAGVTGNFNLANDIIVNGPGNYISTDITNTGVFTLNGRISGSGALILANDSGAGGGVATPARGIDVNGDNSGFTGSISFSNAGLAADQGPVFFRFRSAQSIIQGRPWDIGNNGSTLAHRIDLPVAGVPTTFILGSLTGGAMSGLAGHGSNGGPGGPAIWQIGSLGTSTEFGGVIANGNNAVTKFSTVVKVGAGTLTLSGTNSYTGDTRVEGGILRSTTATVFNDLTDVILLAGTTLNLDFAGDATVNDTVRALQFPGIVPALGLWGAIGNPNVPAARQTSFITGNGLINITQLAVIVGGGSGFGSGVIPEPATGLLLVFAAGWLSALRSRRRK